jgi:hypothetical protein
VSRVVGIVTDREVWIAEAPQAFLLPIGNIVRSTTDFNEIITDREYETNSHAPTVFEMTEMTRASPSHAQAR